MKFYKALQMDPSILKGKIAACSTRQEKTYYWTAIAVRSALIVAFAIVFISVLSGVFGADNTPPGRGLVLYDAGDSFRQFPVPHWGLPHNPGSGAGDSGVCTQHSGGAPAGLFDSAALCGFFRCAFYDHPAARNGQWRFIQLCLHLPDRQPCGWRGSGMTWTLGAGGLFDLWSDPVCQASAPAQNNSFSSSGAGI